MELSEIESPMARKKAQMGAELAEYHQHNAPSEFWGRYDQGRASAENVKFETYGFAIAALCLIKDEYLNGVVAPETVWCREAAKRANSHHAIPQISRADEDWNNPTIVAELVGFLLGFTDAFEGHDYCRKVAKR